MVYRKKKAGVLRRSLLSAFAVIAFLVLGIYIFFGIYFRNHFFYQTNIEDVNVSGMTAEDAAEELRSEVKDYLLTMYDRNGNSYQILGASIDYDYQPTGEEEKLINEQKSFLWPGKITKDKKLDVDKSITYDDALLQEEINDLGCLKEDYMKKPTDAFIQMTDNGYDIVPEDQGNYLIKDKLAARVKAAVDAGETEFTFTDDLYEKPEVTSDDEVLTACMDKIQSYFGAEITYDFGEDKEVVDKSVISSWITIDENYNVTFDEDKAASYVQSLASKYNTYGDEREFKTSKGDTVTIGGGDYGWVIDKEAELEQLLQEVKNGDVKTREPVYSQTAVSRSKNDIGDTYIEIDYTNQHLWYYEKGELKLDTDIVSGNISRGNGSPDGVYKIVYKKSPAVLKGENYASDVTYFMPFAYNVGIHDAPWRHGKFGGTIYKTSGSHGCINVSEDAATTLYKIVEVDTPVVAYYREKVKLTAENTKISNAYSYYDEAKEKAKEEAAKKAEAENAANTPQVNEGERIAEDGSVEAVPAIPEQ